MPIRINLLAEAQAAEEARRKDPVKRAILVGVVLVSCVVCYGVLLQGRLLAKRSQLGSLSAKWRAIEKNYDAAVSSQRQAIEAEQKLTALAKLTTNRFAWATALNALQQTFNSVEDVQTVRLKTEQSYVLIEDKNKPVNGPAKPSTATERITLIVEAMDSSRPPGGQVTKYKDSLAQVPFFQASLHKTNGVRLTSLTPPQSGTGRSPYVMFTLQCDFPEQTR
jgi:hypothetical protein